MMSGAGLVVVGASLAGLRAVEAARRAGYRGAITLVGEEAHLPYDRPPLSKAMLTGPVEATYLASEENLVNDLAVDLRLDCAALGLDTSRRIVSSSDGEIRYERLIIATGSVPRTIPQGTGLQGVHTLRTLDHALEVRSAIGVGTRVVVVGAGFIGAEIASSVCKRSASVTIVEAGAVPLVRAVGVSVGSALAGLHTRNGVRLMLDTSIVEVNGDVSVKEVVVSTGERLPADLLVVGIGAVPATAWLRSAGVELDPIDGAIICDEYLQTSVPGVFAAGDAVNWPNRHFDARMRLENWTNAADQGMHAAVNAVDPDQRQPYETVPYFWSDWYGNRIQFAGAAAGNQASFVQGGPEDERFVALFRSGSRVLGAATLNQPRKIMKLRRLIQQGGTWDEAVALSTT
ncbi:FAD-dependent oxidoreductase [Rhodococcus erythropolis]|nr:FAD-dependent oxidoreductase [Rhodococcus erythropolis]